MECYSLEKFGSLGKLDGELLKGALLKPGGASGMVVSATCVVGM